jgi:hypothetical protein
MECCFFVLYSFHTYIYWCEMSCWTRATKVVGEGAKDRAPLPCRRHRSGRWSPLAMSPHRCQRPTPPPCCHVHLSVDRRALRIAWWGPPLLLRSFAPNLAMFGARRCESPHHRRAPPMAPPWSSHAPLLLAGSRLSPDQGPRLEAEDTPSGI